MNKHMSTRSGWFGLLAGLLALAGTARADGGGAIAPEHRYAWGASVGWINGAATNVGASVEVHVANGEGWLSGFAWGENVGWIKMGADAGGPYGNNTPTNWGVNMAGDGTLSGYAWGQSIGWINFGHAECDAAIATGTGEFSGHAWGENIGWIKFSGTAPDYGWRTELALAPVVGPVTLWRATNQVLKVSDLMLLTNAVDPQGSAMTIEWVSPASTNGGTVVLSGRWVTYNPPVGDDTADYFAFRVENAYGLTTDGRAEVLVFTPASEGQTLNIAGIAPSASNTLVRFVGIPGRAYDVQSTTNLVSTPWTRIGDVVIGAQGYVIFTDTNEPVGQFYRTARPQ